MKKTTLSEHVFKNGVFKTPLSEYLKPMEEKDSWFYSRMPEYLWIALIIDKYGRRDGLEKCYKIILKLKEINKDISLPFWSRILSLEETDKVELFEYMLLIIDRGTLAPLTALFTFSKYPTFSKYFFTKEMNSIEERVNSLQNTMNKCYGHQTNFATDIRFVAVYYMAMVGNLHFRQEHVEMLCEYPNTEHKDEKMRMLRPFIRSSELVTGMIEVRDENYLYDFWKRVSKLSGCNLILLKYENEDFETQQYTEILYEIIQYLAELQKSTQPINNKMSVILGILTYSYKNFKEIVDCKLFNRINGRNALRVIIDDFIILKYLLKKESEIENIWLAYKIYGIGLFKQIVVKSRESTADITLNHINYGYLDILINEDVVEESINIDTRYFDKKNIRLKAKEVNEKELQGLLYDYDSSYTHGLWGAIRESSMLKCDNPAHQYHCVPDYDNSINLPSVLFDSVNILNKTISIVNDIYGVPEDLLKGIEEYETKLVSRKSKTNSE